MPTLKNYIMKKEGYFFGLAAGALSNLSLTKKDKKLLREKYELSEDSNIYARNIGRAVIGNRMGYLVGSVPVRLLNMLESKKNKGYKSPHLKVLDNIWRTGASIYGTNKATEKYSKGALKK